LNTNGKRHIQNEFLALVVQEPGLSNYTAHASNQRSCEQKMNIRIYRSDLQLKGNIP
jgi:hypothetical protein